MCGHVAVMSGCPRGGDAGKTPSPAAGLVGACGIPPAVRRSWRHMSELRIRGPLARLDDVQLATLTGRCDAAAFGPSMATNARIVSPAADVASVGDVNVPVPCL